MAAIIAACGTLFVAIAFRRMKRAVDQALEGTQANTRQLADVKVTADQALAKAEAGSKEMKRLSSLVASMMAAVSALEADARNHNNQDMQIEVSTLASQLKKLQEEMQGIRSMAEGKELQGRLRRLEEQVERVEQVGAADGATLKRIIALLRPIRNGVDEMARQAERRASTPE